MHHCVMACHRGKKEGVGCMVERELEVVVGGVGGHCP